MQKFTTCLWFDHHAEEAAKFYVSIFKNSRILGLTRYSDEVAEVAGQPKGSVMTVSFELEGEKFLSLNGDSKFQFTPAISFMVKCETQAEIDYLWEKLSAGGEEMQCGWLRDKFGVSWQIIPAQLEVMMADPDPSKFQRMMIALMPMIKLDLAVLQKAFKGE
jgi:predicted 3-demethylubiquinone-9 3-methyltransferase (glyoxalase superfamily)